MITQDQYFLGREHSIEQSQNAITMLGRVNPILRRYESSTGRILPISPKTNSQISGTTNGGFRLPDCTEGAPNSSHKQARGVDVYDPDNAIDDWLTDTILEQFGLFREHPDSTPTWCHLTDRAPASGHRTFKP
jgi:hypothetical protein